uniref:Uncharacterized protein n=1 Tax=Rhizophora mucronata TaxID=61149 RepID=A0A2P2QNK1_RHIMU
MKLVSPAFVLAAKLSAKCFTCYPCSCCSRLCIVHGSPESFLNGISGKPALIVHIFRLSSYYLPFLNFYFLFYSIQLRRRF